MDCMLEGLRKTLPAEGQSRVWFAGEKEFENQKKAEKDGVMISSNTRAVLTELGKEYGIEIPGFNDQTNKESS